MVMTHLISHEMYRQVVVRNIRSHYSREFALSFQFFQIIPQNHPDLKLPLISMHAQKLLLFFPFVINTFTIMRKRVVTGTFHRFKNIITRIIKMNNVRKPHSADIIDESLVWYCRTYRGTKYQVSFY